MNNLEITRENKGDEIVLKCIGRLDANRAGYLNDYVNSLVREGCYHICLDMTGIEYLSSAGIRSLLTQYKNLVSVNGYFFIKSMSDNVSQVLSMVGMAEMLSQAPKKTEPGSEKPAAQNTLEANGCNFIINSINSSGKTSHEIYGNPELTMQSGYTDADSRVLKSNDNHFAIGLGAIGESFAECESRFGEFIMLGKSIAYLPADGSKKPDYMVSTGRLVASLTELYGLHFDAYFSHLVRFEPINSKDYISLSQLAEVIKKISAYNKCAFVMIAESGGLIGTSLNTSPVRGKKIFSFPEIKETINFTTEPAYSKMQTISVGFLSSENDITSRRFLRPLYPGSGIFGHVHTAIFPFVPLKKTKINLHETIEYLFNNADLTDILHLTNDTREISGIGESQFVQGSCWIVPLESADNI